MPDSGAGEPTALPVANAAIPVPEENPRQGWRVLAILSALIGFGSIVILRLFPKEALI